MKSNIPETKYPYVMMGHTFYEDGRAVCNKCGNETVCGIIPISIHWNQCIDENKTFNALMSAREEKGSELTIDDLDKILPIYEPKTV